MEVSKRPLRPKDAGTLLLLDRTADGVRVLMGRRHASMAFMANKFVFPGGRTERGDALVGTELTLHPAEAHRNAAAPSPARLRAHALSAIRETAEETGILVGTAGPLRPKTSDWAEFCERGLAPDLPALRLVARAETPPNRTRRFDTRFFAVWRDPAYPVCHRMSGEAAELEDLCWPTLDAALDLDIPDITRTILEDLAVRLRTDPDLAPGGLAFYYRQRGTAWERLPV